MYVDDILDPANEADTLDIYKELSPEYEIKNLRKVSQYLEINIKQLEDECLMLDEENKIEVIVEKFNLTSSKPT